MFRSIYSSLVSESYPVTLLCRTLYAHCSMQTLVKGLASSTTMHEHQLRGYGMSSLSTIPPNSCFLSGRVTRLKRAQGSAGSVDRWSLLESYMNAS